MLMSLQQVSKLYARRGRDRSAAGGRSRHRAGEFVALMGPSGSGKSTCLNILAASTSDPREYRFMDVPTSQLDSDQRALLRRGFLGFVSRASTCCPGPRRSRTSSCADVSRRPGTGPARPRDGGARAVGLAGASTTRRRSCRAPAAARRDRARAGDRSAVVLADEPTGNVDTARAREIMEVLAQLNRITASRS